MSKTKKAIIIAVVVLIVIVAAVIIYKKNKKETPAPKTDPRTTDGKPKVSEVRGTEPKTAAATA